MYSTVKGILRALAVSQMSLILLDKAVKAELISELLAVLRLALPECKRLRLGIPSIVFSIPSSHLSASIRL
jgi:hypothetical protein